jgi:hypothetical protein
MLSIIGAAPQGFGTYPVITSAPEAPYCECTGNEGYSDREDYYVADIGNYCSSWDMMHDYCWEGGSSFGADWCDDPWCYTKEECPGAAPGSYFTGIGDEPLYYNYNVCGAEDSYTGSDDDPCACSGNQGRSAREDYYNDAMGDYCSSWDAMHDYCQEGGSSFGADWCESPWCYTSEECPGAAVGSYFTSVQEDDEEPLYYNYEVCGVDDSYTGSDDDPCACSGNMGYSEREDYYADSMGDYCDVWDLMHDYCQEGGSSYGADWCESPWCYTSAECPGAAVGSYFTGVLMEGEEPLYYNYGVCGADDSYTGTEYDPCACSGNQGYSAREDDYVDSMGDYCDVWDMMHDYCQPGGSSFEADWCGTPWCYTDPSCPGAAQGSYFTGVLEEGEEPLFYNYDVCGAQDTYTGTEDDPLAGGRRKA